MPQRFWGFGERVGGADGGGEPAGFGELAQGFQIGGPLRGDEHGQPPAHERRQRERAELPVHAEPVAGVLAAGDDQGAAGATTITSVTIGGVPVTVNPAPDTVVNVAGIAQLVINEQGPARARARP